MEQTQIAAAKAALRHEARIQAAALSADYCRAASGAIAARLLADERWQRAESVFLFVSMPTEPDTAPLFAAAFAAGKAVYVPKCGRRPAMQAVRIRSLGELAPGVLGIPEPVDCSETADAAALGLIVVPCVAAAADGRRLGHGGAYYDAFLQDGGGETVCLCFSALLKEDIPVTPRDVRMDDVLTEHGFCRTAGR